jgi:signal peptidase I
MKQETFLKILTRLFGLIILGLIILWILIYFGFNKLKLQISCPVQKEIKIVHGNSLAPLVPSGSKIQALFGYYNCREIKRGDLVLYRYAGDKVPLLKIVKGIPGDSFHLVKNDKGEYNLIINGKIVVNSQNIPYSFNENRYRMLSLYENDYKGVIPPNTYLLLGDQINGSIDSSVFGLVDKSNILGKAIILKK